MENLIKNKDELPVINEALDYKNVGIERVVTLLSRQIEGLSQEVHDLKVSKVLAETSLPKELLEANNLLPIPPRVIKRGRGYRPILKSEIEEAQAQGGSAGSQARYLKISYPLYRKYARLYGIHKTDQHAPRLPNLYSPERGKYPISEILDNKHPHLNDYIVKDKIIRGKTLPAKCNICGYDKRRIVDNKVCLLLDHLDGDKKNFKLDNLQLLCLNCTFECGRGYIRSGKHQFDVDWMQGANSRDIDTTPRW